MLDIDRINKFLNLLHFNLILNGNTYYLEDLDFQSIIPIKKNENKYTVMAYRDNSSYEFMFSERELIIKNDDLGEFVLNRHGFSYQKKELNSQYNSLCLSIKDSCFRIYRKDSSFVDDDASRYFGIRVYEDLDYMKLSKTVEKEDVLKDDTVIQLNTKGVVRENTKRKYDSSGSLVFSDTLEEYMSLPINLCIIDTISNDLDVIDMLDQFEEMIPGIISYLESHYSKFKDIFQQHNIRKKNVLSKKAID